MSHVSVHIEHLVVFVGIILPAWTAVVVAWLDKRYERSDK